MAREGMVRSTSTLLPLRTRGRGPGAALAKGLGWPGGGS